MENPFTVFNQASDEKKASKYLVSKEGKIPIETPSEIGKTQYLPKEQALKMISSGEATPVYNVEEAKKLGIETESMRMERVRKGDESDRNALRVATGALNLVNTATLGLSDRLLPEDAKEAKETLGEEYYISKGIGQAAGLLAGGGVVGAAGRVLAKGVGGLARYAAGAKYIQKAVSGVAEAGVTQAAGKAITSAAQKATASKLAGTAGGVVKESLKLGSDFAKYGFAQGMAEAGTDGKDILDTLSHASDEAMGSFKVGSAIGLALGGLGKTTKILRSKLSKKGKLKNLSEKRLAAEDDFYKVLTEETSIKNNIAKMGTKEAKALGRAGLKLDKAALKANRLDKAIANVENYGITGSKSFAKMKDAANSLVFDKAIRTAAVAAGASTGGAAGALVGYTMNPQAIRKMISVVGGGAGKGIKKVTDVAVRGVKSPILYHVGDNAYRDMVDEIEKFDTMKQQKRLEDVVPNYDDQFKQLIINDELQKSNFLKQKVQQMKPKSFPGLAKTAVSVNDKRKLADYVSGTYEPEVLVERFNDGTITKEIIEAVNNSEPGIVEAMRSMVSDIIQTEQKPLNMDTIRNVSTLLGMPSPYSSVPKYLTSAVQPGEEEVGTANMPKLDLVKKTNLQRLMSGENA